MPAGRHTIHKTSFRKFNQSFELTHYRKTVGEYDFYFTGNYGGELYVQNTHNSHMENYQGINSGRLYIRRLVVQNIVLEPLNKIITAEQARAFGELICNSNQDRMMAYSMLTKLLNGNDS